MKKTLIKAVVASFLSVSGCSTYNSIVLNGYRSGRLVLKVRLFIPMMITRFWWNPFSWF